MGWKKFFRYNTTLERRLFLSVAILSVVVLVLFICLVASPREPITCKTPECIRAAKYILDTVDTTINPCEDFYNFACGTFLKNAYSLGQPTTLNHLRDLTNNKLKEIVTEATNEKNMSTILKMQRKLYRACTNEKDIEDDRNKRFFKLLDELMGGWPVVKNNRWVEQDFEWKKVMLKARNLGFFFEFFFKVEMDLCSKNDTYSLWIRPPSTENISSFHWKDQNVNAITEIAEEMGAGSVETRSHLRRVILFAEQLDHIVEKYENATANRNMSEVKRIAIKDLDHMYIKVNWIRFLTNITGLPLQGDELVIFDVGDYFRDLYFLLMKTQRKVQANYIAWAIISTNIDYLTKNVREKYKKIVKCTTHSKADFTRSEKCYHISKGLLPYVAESEYIRRYTTQEKRKYITDIINNVKHEMEVALDRNSWMDRETKENVIRHLKSINGAVGWTNLIFDERRFEQFFGYDQVRMDSINLIDMVRSLAIHGANSYYKRLTYNADQVTKDYFQRPQLQVNAYYMSYLKTIVLLTPITQGFLFNLARPHYMNYGSLGSVIGHELTHGVTEYSLKIDDNTPLWSNKSREDFQDLAQCLVDEYDTYINSLDELTSNGTVVLMENLADVTGINLAYTAYREWARHNAHEVSLPGVKYTPRQIFWITASNYLCQDAKVPSKDAKPRIEIHGTPRFRVISRVKNSPHFAHDFGCPAGSKMNPEKKCRIFT